MCTHLLASVAGFVVMEEGSANEKDEGPWASRREAGSFVVLRRVYSLDQVANQAVPRPPLVADHPGRAVAARGTRPSTGHRDCKAAQQALTQVTSRGRILG